MDSYRREEPYEQENGIAVHFHFTSNYSSQPSIQAGSVELPTPDCRITYQGRHQGNSHEAKCLPRLWAMVFSFLCTPS